MKGKIGLEEHFAIDDTLNDSKGYFPDETWAEVRDRIMDIHGRRLRLKCRQGPPASAFRASRGFPWLRLLERVAEVR